MTNHNAGSISPEEQDRLALPENRAERLARLQAYSKALHAYAEERRTMTKPDPWAPFTTYQAAQDLGISENRVRQLIRAGKLPARKAGRDWLIIYDDLNKVRDRKPGRPPHEAR